MGRFLLKASSVKYYQEKSPFLGVLIYVQERTNAKSGNSGSEIKILTKGNLRKRGHMQTNINV